MRPLKLIGVTFVALLLLIVAFLLIPAPWPKGSPPPELPFTSADRRCEVTFDDADVPHLRASSKELLFACLGRLHAEDRAWQMDYLRRVAYGRMAERYGQKYVKGDFMMRLIDLETPAARWEKTLATKHPGLHRLLAYYTLGVNAAFDDAFRSAHQAPSFSPGPWRIRDSLVVALLQSFYQTRKTFTADLLHARMRRELGAARYKLLYGAAEENQARTTILKRGEHRLIPKKRGPRGDLGAESAPAKRLALGPAVEVLLDALDARDLAGLGSNNWVVSAKHSASGRALLANDPHLDITTPSFWYEAHLEGDGLHVSGLTVPGLPAVIVGHNRHVAWGITNGYSNVADVIAVRREGNEIVLGGRRLPVREHRPVVRVRFGPLEVPVFWKRFERTPLGPLLTVPGESKTLLLRWTGYHLGEAAIGAMIGLARARSIHEVDGALKRWELPCFNVVFADRHGRIGYRHVGKVAKRAKGAFGLLDGDAPLEWWQGFLTASEMPSLLDPARGYLATANNRPVPRSYPYFLGHAYSSPWRATRIEELLAAKHEHSLEDMKRIQTDARDPRAAATLRPMLALVASSDEARGPLARDALARLARWDLQARRESCEATIFTLWFETLRQALVGEHRVDIEVLAAMVRGEGGVDAEKLRRLAASTFSSTLKKLQKDLGGAIETWRWERYHLVTFEPLRRGGAHPPPVGVAGSDGTVNVAPARGKGPFDAAWGASYRLVVELGPKIRSFGALAGKQRDRRPRELGKQQKLWVRGAYRQRPFYRDEVQRAARSDRLLRF